MSTKVNLTKEQQQVIDVKNCDVLVAASAGSGKTFVVVERIINRVVNDNVDIDKILVVTFTNAAASELKERIVNRFYDYLKDNDIDDIKRKHIQKQLTLINRAQISTIHSFCLNIIKNNFFLLNIDPNVKTLDENKAKILLLESINEVIDEEYEQKTDLFFKILELFKSEDNIISCLEKMYNFSRGIVDSNNWLEGSLERYNLNNISDLSETDFGREIMTMVNERVELLDKELLFICNKIRSDKDFESRLKILEDMQEKINSIKNVVTYDDMYNRIKSILPFPRLPSSKCVNEDLKNEVASIKKKVTNELENMTKTLYLDTKGVIEELNSMYDILKWYVDKVIKLSEVYSIKKNTLGQIDFNDYEHLALKVLEDKNVSNQFRNKFEEIYIDEYQDTSYIQEAIIDKIAKNNRVMVGDVKQSIYSFRNAEPKLFNEKYNSYEKYWEENLDGTNQTKIMLSRNFRSRKEVLDSINDIFRKVMSEKIGECNYTNEEYLIYGDGYNSENDIDYNTEINIVETKEDNNEDDVVLQEIEEITTTQKEAYEVAKKIENIIKEEYEIYDLKKKEYRKAQYKDIVILMRSVTGKASIYEEVLKAKNIPVFCDTSESFYNGGEVSIILSLLKVIDNIYDDIALVSVMYSIIGNFTADELTYIRNYNKKGYFYDAIYKAYLDEKNKDKEIYIKIENFFNMLRRFTVYLNTYTIAETILKIYEETGIYYSFYLEELGKQKCANLDSLIEVARNFEREEKSSLYEFINYIENMKESKSKGSDTPKLLGEGENVVRILTIHKSKGLEYPIVFLVNSSKKYNTLDSTAELLFDKELGIGMDIYNTKLGISYASIIKQAIKEKIKNRTLSEEERLLYVAMTRAKEKLYVYGTVKEYDKFVEKLLSSSENISPVLVKECNSYLKLIMFALNTNKLDNLNNFKVNVITSKENNKNVAVSKSNVIDRSISVKEKFLHTCNDKKINKKEIKRDFEKKYKYIDNLDIKKKYSATEIKQNTKTEEELYDLLSENDYNLSLESIKPKSIADEHLSALNYGTLIHRILEKIDYYNICNENIDKYIELEASGTDLNTNNIKNKINNYLKSGIMSYLQNAKEIKKEQPFVIYDNLDNIDGCNFKEKTYIQGIIDLLITTHNDERIIVDFKTDRVDNEQELLDRYKVQLEVYKKGVELSCNTKVNNILIYSFYLDKLIKVEI